MTEVHAASSDAKNINTRATLVGDEYVINGEKHYISGVGDPRCKIMITMVQTSPDGPAQHRQSQILVPTDAPGVNIVGPMAVFGNVDAPHGHMHIIFDNVRVPASNMLLGEGRGFEISQLRLGPGRIHHCMRAIGQAEKALDLMVTRGLTREAFGKQLVQLGGNLEIISKAIQMHGALGVSQKTPLAQMYTSTRTLRIADGPDEVHHMVVGRNELRQYREMPHDPSTAAIFRN